MDNLSPENRKKNMSRIRSRGNRTTERRLRSSLVGAGVSGIKMHPADLPGKPDFAFPEQRIAIFVDGCFWHGCPKCYIRPKSSQSYWDEKLWRNRARDIKVSAELEQLGWTVIRIWEHDIKRPAKARRVVVKALALAGKS